MLHLIIELLSSLPPSFLPLHPLPPLSTLLCKTWVGVACSNARRRRLRPQRRRSLLRRSHNRAERFLGHISSSPSAFSAQFIVSGFKLIHRKMHPRFVRQSRTYRHPPRCLPSSPATFSATPFFASFLSSRLASVAAAECIPRDAQRSPSSGDRGRENGRERDSRL